MYMLYIIIVITYMLNILKQHSLADKVFGTKSYVKKKKKKRRRKCLFYAYTAIILFVFQFLLTKKIK